MPSTRTFHTNPQTMERDPGGIGTTVRRHRPAPPPLAAPGDAVEASSETLATRQNPGRPCQNGSVGRPSQGLGARRVVVRARRSHLSRGRQRTPRGSSRRGGRHRYWPPGEDSSSSLTFQRESSRGRVVSGEPPPSTRTGLRNLRHAELDRARLRLRLGRNAASVPT